jgi:hypothetical protein
MYDTKTKKPLETDGGYEWPGTQSVDETIGSTESLERLRRGGGVSRSDCNAREDEEEVEWVVVLVVVDHEDSEEPVSADLRRRTEGLERGNCRPLKLSDTEDFPAPTEAL